ncbi:MAG: response regulator, partial [Planctomycetes bacterium]|nr:response regulator [Planctomycetota bacterium]
MPATKTVASTGPPIRALIVDNDAAHAETMADSLSRVGYECTVATTGSEGAALLKKDAFEIVISDLKMPDVGGLEILAICKEKLPDAEVILVTGYGTVGMAVGAMKGGADDF